jgi:hypothetical protein
MLSCRCIAYTCTCISIVVRSWRDTQNNNFTADISVTTSSQNLKTFRHLYQLNLTVFLSPSGHLFLSTLWPPLSAELTVFLSLSGHLSARADCISLTQNLFRQLPKLTAFLSPRILAHLATSHQRELTVFLLPHHPRILGRLATSISQIWQYFYHCLATYQTVFPSPHHPRILHGMPGHLQS